MTPLQEKIKELQLRRLKGGQIRNREVPSKKKSKPLPYKMQNTFEKSLRGVPGGNWFKQAHANGTGCRVRKEEIGLLRSARNSNTTSGNYVETIVH